MFSRFFIDRPVFAWVIAIVIMLAGTLSILNLPVSQYPMIAPPQVSISATYPGASAQTIENTVTQVIEQNLTGLDGYMYMNSTSDSSGRVSITVTFEAGTDPDMAQVQVQNKIQTAISTLPQVVQQLGVTIQKTSASFLMVVGFISTDGRMNAADLSDFLVSNIQEPLSRVYGVGEADVRRLGLPYAPAEQGWRVTVPDPAAAAELIRREPALFRDFELTKGRMDDVFLAVTGKKLAGGAEK